VRIAALGDIHGNLTALEAVLADIARQDVQAVVCLGDLAFRGPQPEACVARVRGLGIPCVYGNTDLLLLSATPGPRAADVPAACRAPEAALPWVRWHLERLSPADLEYLAALPFAHRLEADGQRLLFVHATPRDCTSNLEPHQPAEAVADLLRGAEADWVLFGHVHRAFAFRADGVQLVNTGAVGFSLDGDWRAAYAIVDTASGSIELRRVAYDLERAVRAAREAGFCFPLEEYAAALRRGFWENIPWERRRPPQLGDRPAQD
jgi:putative phosphoesterase